MKKALFITGSFILILSFPACQKCTSCSLEQNGVSVSTSGTVCGSKKKTEGFDESLKSKNQLLDYANAEITCTGK
jgi:hypothetical protein